MFRSGKIMTKDDLMCPLCLSTISITNRPGSDAEYLNPAYKLQTRIPDSQTQQKKKTNTRYQSEISVSRSLELYIYVFSLKLWYHQCYKSIKYDFTKKSNCFGGKHYQLTNFDSVFIDSLSSLSVHLYRFFHFVPATDLKVSPMRSWK